MSLSPNNLLKIIFGIVGRLSDFGKRKFIKSFLQLHKVVLCVSKNPKLKIMSFDIVISLGLSRFVE